MYVDSAPTLSSFTFVYTVAAAPDDENLGTFMIITKLNHN